MGGIAETLATSNNTDHAHPSPNLAAASALFTPALASAIRRSLAVGTAVPLSCGEPSAGRATATCSSPSLEIAVQLPLSIEVLLHDGRTVQISLTRDSVDDAEAGIAVAARDITRPFSDEKATSPIVRKEEHVFDSAPAGIFQATLQGRPLFANRSLVRMLGFDSPKEFLSVLPDSSHTLWADASERTRLLEEVDACGAVFGREYQLRRKDGSLIWASINIRRICDDDGEPPWLEGFIEEAGPAP